MNRREAAEFALESLRKAGIEKAQANASEAEKQELNIEAGELSLFRTTHNQSLALRAVHESRQAELKINRFDRDAIGKAIADLQGLLAASNQDEAYDIAPAQPPKSFEYGPREPNLEEMYGRLTDLAKEVESRFPKIRLRDVHASFSSSGSVLRSSQGVDFEALHGSSGLTAVFMANENGKSSSFNYVFGALPDFRRPLLDCLGLHELLRQSSEQVNTKPVSGKFEGDLIVTPHCMESLLGAYLGQLGDGPLIAGTSLFRDKLERAVASPLLTVRSDPAYPAFAQRGFFDSEGFAMEQMPVFEAGVLKNFLLSQYGARKTGRKKAASSEFWVMDSGQEELSDMIRSVKKGVLLCRFSGGRPSQSGDFSGVAKNSYYIENGEIQFPIAETMVAGNLLDAFSSIRAISKSRINFGASILPWVQMGPVTISGK